MFEKLLNILEYNDTPIKTIGSIYVKEESHIEPVRKIISEVDPFEFEYISDNSVMVFDENQLMEYNHKFELTKQSLLKVKEKCNKMDIDIVPIYSSDYNMEFKNTFSFSKAH